MLWVFECALLERLKITGLCLRSLLLLCPKIIFVDVCSWLNWLDFHPKCWLYFAPFFTPVYQDWVRMPFLVFILSFALFLLSLSLFDPIYQDWVRMPFLVFIPSFTLFLLSLPLFCPCLPGQGQNAISGFHYELYITSFVFVPFLPLFTKTGLFGKWLDEVYVLVPRWLNAWLVYCWLCHNTWIFEQLLCWIKGLLMILRLASGWTRTEEVGNLNVNGSWVEAYCKIDNYGSPQNIHILKKIMVLYKIAMFKRCSRFINYHILKKIMVLYKIPLYWRKIMVLYKILCAFWRKYGFLYKLLFYFFFFWTSFIFYIEPLILLLLLWICRDMIMIFEM